MKRAVNTIPTDVESLFLRWTQEITVTAPVIQLKPGETNCGNPFYKKVIFTHNKDLCLQEGAWLIDDRIKNGASEFGERHILFLSEKFPDWQSVVDYFMKMIKSEKNK